MIDSIRGKALAERARALFVDLVELDKTAPHEVTEICAAMQSHLRAFRPQAVVREQLEQVNHG